MLDIQIPLDAPETYGYIPLKDMPEQEYNAEKDVTKYPGVEAQSYVTCYPGMFAIFFPQDGHQPCISDAPQIKKAIFKAEV
jgi:YhcH/YjgK/YiaL family protein